MRWRYTECRGHTSTENTELDWHQAFYNLHYYGDDSFSLTDFANVYKEYCGGMCSRSKSKPTWMDLLYAIRAEFGQDSDEERAYADVLTNHKMDTWM